MNTYKKRKENTMRVNILFIFLKIFLLLYLIFKYLVLIVFLVF